MKPIFPLIVCVAAAPAMAEETREMAAHQHGVGALNIAVDGNMIEMDLRAPGADIVGFEHPAEQPEDQAAVDAALALLAAPMDLFVLPAAAGCSVVEVQAMLLGGAAEGRGNGTQKPADHDHESHAHDHHDHDDHDADHGHTGAERSDTDHAESDHAGHDGHDHPADDAEADHGAGSIHSEFHATYRITCADTEALTGMTFAYFDRFETARELEVQILTRSGAQAVEVLRIAPKLDLRDLF
ncbi:zinc uptake protein ZrgA [Phaeobacter inhibens]|uniref:zinc uptake protein ZrgA n=1 Tax=Phaeobacter inhibens TaxID=221822 RepID=UPI000C9C154E|nr:DUF2796 domain-containing protein [Phaeobacter inhibens]AUQ66164.1 ABC-type Zn2+ transport system, periplasmic component/surface adhesin [Phaeobacter inhibens]